MDESQIQELKDSGFDMSKLKSDVNIDLQDILCLLPVSIITQKKEDLIECNVYSLHIFHHTFDSWAVSYEELDDTALYIEGGHSLLDVAFRVLIKIVRDNRI